jgi:hypothetical protein
VSEPRAKFPGVAVGRLRGIRASRLPGPPRPPGPLSPAPAASGNRDQSRSPARPAPRRSCPPAPRYGWPRPEPHSLLALMKGTVAAGSGTRGSYPGPGGSRLTSAVHPATTHDSVPDRDPAHRNVANAEPVQGRPVGDERSVDVDAGRFQRQAGPRDHVQVQGERGLVLVRGSRGGPGGDRGLRRSLPEAGFGPCVCR